MDDFNDIVHGGPAQIAVQRYAAMSTLGFDDEDGLMQKGLSKTNATASPSRVEKVVRPADLQPVTLHEPEPVDVTSANVSSPAGVIDEQSWRSWTSLTGTPRILFCMYTGPLSGGRWRTQIQKEELHS